MLEDHVCPFLRQWHMGLGFYCEQGLEGIHSEFNTQSQHFDPVGSQLLQGWIWLVLANVRWRWWQPIRDHCFSGRVSLTATNITRPTLYFIEEIYQFLCTVSVFVHRTRITFDRRGDCGLRERRRERRYRGLRERRRDRSFALKKKKASRASRKHNARMC